MAAPLSINLVSYFSRTILTNTHFRNSRTYFRILGQYGRGQFPHFYTTGPNFFQRKRLSLYLRVGIGGCITAATGVAFVGDGEPKTATVSSSDGREKFLPTRKIRNELDTSGLKLTLYQYQTCPFCCKVRAYLDYKGFSYDVVEVNSVRRSQVKWSKYKKVPILVCDNGKDVLQLNDSSVIISVLESFLLDRAQPIAQFLSYYPEIETENSRGKTVFEYPNRYFLMHGDAAKFTDERKNEQRWRQWSDDVLVHVLSPNIYLTPRQSYHSFLSFSEAGEWEKTFSFLERWTVIIVGSVAMYFIGKMLKKKYSLKDDVRESLYDACDDWMSAVSRCGTPFLGGSEPNLADLAVYGELNAIEGCEAFSDLVTRDKRLQDWYKSTRRKIRQNAGKRVL